jgi:two-component system cell cycle sensor histidine kinase/response regulator CckA
LKFSFIDIKSLLLDVITSQSVFTDKEGVELKHRLESVPGIMLDETQMFAAVSNLIVNARHALVNSKRKTICIELTSDSATVTITVSDNGCGITPELKEKIFLPFYTTKGAYSKNSHGIKGTGLGLALVNRIIDEHDGTISVSSEPGNGTSFKIVLPVRSKTEDNQTPRQAVRVKPVAITKDSVSIMMVDDNSQLARNFKKLLATIGYHNVEIFTSSVEALQHLEKSEVDLVFLDIMMPEMNGPTLQKRVRKIKPHIQTVFITGNVELNDQKLLEETGAVSIIYKPFGIDQIISLMNCLTQDQDVE